MSTLAALALLAMLCLQPPAVAWAAVEESAVGSVRSVQPLALMMPSGGPTDGSQMDGPEAHAASSAAGGAALAAPATGGPRTEIIVHTVQPGDTLYGIADQYGISVETLIWANNMEANPDLLRLGQELSILPVSGVMHVVRSGDTLGGIAAKYGVSIDEIRNCAANHLEGESPVLHIGQKIIVPGANKPQPAPAPVAARAPAAAAASAPPPPDAPAGSAHFIWPIGGSVTQRYRTYHRALDIGGANGGAIVASDSGYVAIAGWSRVGYGNYVVIDHGNGYRTLYAHLKRIDVKAGQAVQQGQVIGAEGATGNATGPHLHFEILQNGVPVNPAGLLS